MTRAAIIATVGPASQSADVLCAMAKAGMTIARLNGAWIPDRAEALRQIAAVRAGAAACGRAMPVLVDLPGRRVAGAHGHTYDPAAPLLSDAGETILAAAIEERVEMLALSFVGSAADVNELRARVRALGGTQPIIAKIERKIAIDHMADILASADGIMVARGDLGQEMPLEDIPFVQEDLVRAAKAAHKPVIVATQMLLSMTRHEAPTRAEVADVARAVEEGADAVMLSEETATGAYPALAVAEMARIITEAQPHAAAALTPFV